MHAAAAAAGVETGSGPLEDSLPSFVAQTFQERYRVRPCVRHALLRCRHRTVGNSPEIGDNVA